VFYEQTGALRDVVENHLMQLLSLVLIENDGKEINIKDLPKLRYDALTKIEIIENFAKCTRGQYLGYAEEVGNSKTFVETFAKVSINSISKTFSGIKINLITGKYFNAKESFIQIIFKDNNEYKIDLNSPDAPSLIINDYINLKYEPYEYVFISAIRGNKVWFVSDEEIIRS
jgi:glucose-6-phosphate 1-dehydrogenase